MQRTPYREKTLFVTIEPTGVMHWLDHSGRMGHAGGWGEIRHEDGKPVHYRGGQRLSPKQIEAELQEYTIDVELTPTEFATIRLLIMGVGKPWLEGWGGTNSQKLHTLLEGVYWRHVNRFVNTPFSEQSN